MSAISRLRRAIRQVVLGHEPDPRPYQSVHFRGVHYPGMFNTRTMFYSLDIARELPGRSFVDLGCNVGGLVLLAEDHGAAPTLGVDRSPENIARARDVAGKAGAKSRFVEADIVAYLEQMEPADVVSCTAVFRHLYGLFMTQHDPAFKQPKGYLTYNSLDVLVRQNVGHPAPVIERYNQTLARMLSLTRSRFICSYNDGSGLLARRGDEVRRYFSALSPRVREVEVYIYDPRNPKFVMVSIRLAE